MMAGDSEANVTQTDEERMDGDVEDTPSNTLRIYDGTKEGLDAFLRENFKTEGTVFHDGNPIGLPVCTLHNIIAKEDPLREELKMQETYPRKSGKSYAKQTYFTPVQESLSRVHGVQMEKGAKPRYMHVYTPDGGVESKTMDSWVIPGLRLTDWNPYVKQVNEQEKTHKERQQEREAIKFAKSFYEGYESCGANVYKAEHLKDTYIARLTGENSTYCINKGGTHDGNKGTAFLMIKKNKKTGKASSYMRCSCRKEHIVQRGGMKCSKYKSAPCKLNPAQKDLFFPPCIGTREYAQKDLREFPFMDPNHNPRDAQQLPEDLPSIVTEMRSSIALLRKNCAKTMKEEEEKKKRQREEGTPEE